MDSKLNIGDRIARVERIEKSDVVVEDYKQTILFLLLCLSIFMT